MRVSIHQPEHLPWLGLLNKIKSSDVFVVLDTVQFSKGNFQNRNKIRSSSKNGFAWLTVPITDTGLHTKIIDIKISNKAPWKERYLQIMKENYKKSPYFDYYYTEISKIINNNYSKLVDLNMDLLHFILKEFSICTKIVYASDLKLPPITGGSNVVLYICKLLGTTEYLSGSGGKNYLITEDFSKEGIEVNFLNFKHPEYDQQYLPFLEYMSSLDLLFNKGSESAKKILFNNKNLNEQKTN